MVPLSLFWPICQLKRLYYAPLTLTCCRSTTFHAKSTSPICSHSEANASSPTSVNLHQSHYVPCYCRSFPLLVVLSTNTGSSLPTPCSYFPYNLLTAGLRCSSSSWKSAPYCAAAFSILIYDVAEAR